MIEIRPVKHDEQEELFAMAQRSWSEWMPNAATRAAVTAAFRATIATSPRRIENRQPEAALRKVRNTL